MKYKNSDDNRYRVQFMRSTEELMDQLTVKEFISYLEENAEFEDYTVEYIDKKCVKCRAYDLTEENSKLHKEFLVTEDGRVFYWRSLISKIELVDDEPIPKKPLKDRTNEDLVIEYQTTHNEDLFRALLEKNTGLLHIIVMDYRIPKYEIEDLLSESYIALIKAVDNFDPTRGVTFTTALKVFVRQHLNRLYTEATRQKRYNGMDPASYEELVEIHKDDVRGLDCDRFTQIEVDEYLEGLEAKDRYVVTLLLRGYNLSDCAKALNITNAKLTNGTLKQVFNKIYVGVIPVEGKVRPRKVLIFSYAVMGYTVEEIVKMYYDKGYADKDTKISITLNSGNEANS